MTPALGIAPLSALSTPPVEFIAEAAKAGFTAVGLRLLPVTPTDRVIDRREFAAVKAALDASGLTVLDIEVLSLDADSTRDHWLPAMQLGAELGARYLNVVGDDPDLGSFAATLATVVADARQFGLEALLEPVAYRPLNSFPLAIDIARQVGCSVELDALHFLRTGGTLDSIAANAELFPILQFCDAPAEAPADPLFESRAHRLLPGEGVAPLRELVAALPNAAISVEIPNDELRSWLGVDGYFSLLHRAATEFLQADVTAR